jgi:N-acyl-L-homoserine lactone synthetase
MITLTPITDAAKLQEYYRFRYRIYSESRNKVFLTSKNGVDLDEHDARAMHFGWYMDGTLAACERLIPLTLPEECYQLKGLCDETARHATLAYLGAHLARGHRMMESSRTCLDVPYRSMANAKQLILAIVATSHSHGYDHGLFGCDRSQAAFYLRLGFEVIEGASHIAIEGTMLTKCMMKYDYSRILERNREALQAAAMALIPIPLAA